MDDQAAARVLVGAVLGEEVVSLQPLPQARSRAAVAGGTGRAAVRRDADGATGGLRGHGAHGDL